MKTIAVIWFLIWPVWVSAQYPYGVFPQDGHSKYKFEIETISFTDTKHDLLLPVRVVVPKARPADTIISPASGLRSWKRDIPLYSGKPGWDLNYTPLKTPWEQRFYDTKSTLSRTLYLDMNNTLHQQQLQWLYGLGGEIIKGIMTNGR